MAAMAESSAQEKLQAEEARADFVARFPGYKKTALLDDLRATEYRRLDERGQVYLDYTGGSLYAESQLQKHYELLRSGVLGNPHSASPASVAMTEHVERTRRQILNYFNARAEDYILVFTQNASAALKLVGESFPFAPGSRYLLTVRQSQLREWNSRICARQRRHGFLRSAGDAGTAAGCCAP